MDALDRISTAVSDLADPVAALAAITEEVAALFDSRLALTFVLGEGVRGRHVIVSEPVLRDGAECVFCDQIRDPSRWLEALRRRDFSLLDNQADTSLMAEDWKARVPAEDMGRLLVVPLLVRGSTVGALAIFRARKSRPFQERDRRLAESIATMLTRTIGLAVQTEELDHFFAASLGDITARLAQEQALRESDITERKAAEDALRENRKRLEDLVFVVGDWIWEADAEYHYTQCSDGVRAVLGYAPSEVIGKTPWEFMTAGDAEEMRRYALDRVAKKQGCSEVVNHNLHRDGREVILLTSCVPILDDSGELLGFRGIDKDITIATQTQESLRRSVVELNALWQIAETVAGPGELIAALNSVTRQISDALEARFTLAVTFGEGGEGRHVVASRPAETAWYEEIFLQQAPEHLGDLAKMAESGEPVVINDILKSEILPKEMTQKVGGYGFSRLLLIPLVLQTQIIGTLMVTRGPEGSPFRERDIEFAQAAAGSVAAAAVHARLRVEENLKTADQVRDHLARELHDAVTQSVYSASLIAQALPTIWQRSPADGLVGLGQLQRLVRSALAELRILLYELRPGTLAGVGLDQLLDRLGDSLAGQADVAVEIDARIEEPPPAEVKEAMYRIAQEAFNNIAKHARAQRVLASAVTGRWGAVLEVEDDGVGVDVEAIEGGHMGLAIMRERAEEIGAEFRIDRIEPSGTRVSVRWVAPEGVLGG
jgi:PAS domain S-box-containing protein